MTELRSCSPVKRTGNGLPGGSSTWLATKPGFLFILSKRTGAGALQTDSMDRIQTRYTDRC
jgi:hypothetical protein